MPGSELESLVMQEGAQVRRRCRFGVFEFDSHSGELRNKAGTVVRLQPQPLRLLGLLVGRPGEVVTREEIRQHLWQGETFVDFEHAVNFSVRQIRAALGDDAKAPRYVETLPRKGYRFIAPVEIVDPESSSGSAIAQGASAVPGRPHVRYRTVLLAAGLLVALLWAALWIRPRNPSSWDNEVDRAAVLVKSRVPEAREAYLRGRYLWSKGGPSELEQALSHFEEAVRLDPELAPAYAGIADTYQLLANIGTRAAKDAFPKARSAAERALELAPGLGEAQMVLGTVLFRFDWNWAAAEKALRAAVEMDPESAAARHDYAWFLISMTRFDEGIAQMRRAHELDPLSLRANVDIGWAFLRAGRVDEAIAHLRRIVELEPDFAGAEQCLEAAYAYKGLHAEALKYAKLSLERAGVEPESIVGAGREDSRSALESIWRWRLSRLEKSEGVIPVYRIASYYALLGDPDRAAVWLDRAFEARDPSLVVVHVDEAFHRFRKDPRFEELLGRVGLLSLNTAAN